MTGVSLPPSIEPTSSGLPQPAPLVQTPVRPRPNTIPNPNSVATQLDTETQHVAPKEHIPEANPPEFTPTAAPIALKTSPHHPSRTDTAEPVENASTPLPTPSSKPTIPAPVIPAPVIPAPVIPAPVASSPASSPIEFTPPQGTPPQGTPPASSPIEFTPPKAPQAEAPQAEAPQAEAPQAEAPQAEAPQAESLSPELPPEPQPSTSPAATPTATPEPPRYTLTQLSVVGSSLLDQAELAPLLQPFQGKSVSEAELQALSDRITQMYLERGYLNSRAILDIRQLRQGIGQIQVLEGRIGHLEINGTQRLHPRYIRQRLQQAIATPLHVGELENQLKLLRADPLLSTVEASLRPGDQLGESDLYVQVKEARNFEGAISSDNYSPPSVGGEQVSLDLNYRNLTGIGDQLQGGYKITRTAGAQTWNLAYRLPLNPMNGTLQWRGSWSRHRVTEDPFDVLEIRGRSQLYDLTYRQPLFRNPREELAVSLGLTHQRGQTFLFNDIPTPFGLGPDADGNSRTTVIKLAQDYLKRDPGGAWSVRSQLSLGTSLLGATLNPDPVPDGRFVSWLTQIQRVQRLGDNHLLIAIAEAQLTPDPLLPSQQFVIGGGQSLRGYRQNTLSGDNGFRLSLEDRITIKRDGNTNPILQLTPFLEVGTLWNHPRNPNPLPPRTTLASIGLGLLWQATPRLSIRLDYGLPLIRPNTKGHDLQDHGLYFSTRYGF